MFRAAAAGAFFPTDWSGDERMVAAHSYPRGDISLLSLESGGSVPLVESPFSDWVASISADGRWVAYVQVRVEGWTLSNQNVPG